MKNKLKKHGVKILTMIICMVTIVTAFVIVPSADTYDDNMMHYWFYLNANDDITVPNDGSMQFVIKIRSDNKSKINYIYARENNTNRFATLYLQNYNITFSITKGVSVDYEEYITSSLVIESTDPWQGSEYNHQRLDFYKTYDQNGNCTSMRARSTLLEHDFDLNWLPSYGNYNLQLWTDLNSINDVIVYNSTYLSYTYFSDVIDSVCRYKIISKPKTYTQGYTAGVDFGLEEGYNNGYDQGSIDGYQQGYTEGETIGYNDGYEVGYSDGNGDGYSLGYDEGEAYGWQNGFGAGQNDMAKTNETFKDMVFAIFDAPSVLIDGMLNFNIFGINLAGLVKTIITLAVVAVIVFAILKFTKG